MPMTIESRLNDLDFKQIFDFIFLKI